MKVYLVGGAVRDELLDLPVKERDWVVTGATAEEMIALGFTRADARFPVFIHPETGDEYALARRETKSGPGYKGFDVYAGPDVALEEDLGRRDLTINAMARDGEGRVIDPYDGREDLRNGLLRHVSAAFSEDPVRLLRVARFAAKLGRWGFRVAHGTHALMCRMAGADDLLTIAPDRLWREMKGALAEPQPWRFFEVLKGCGALDRLLPALAAELGPAPAHQAGGREGRGIDALKRAVASSADPRVRYAALVAGIAGKSGEVAGVPAEKSFSTLAGRAATLEAHYLEGIEGDAEAVLRVLTGSRSAGHRGRLDELLLVWGSRRPETAARGAALFERALGAIARVDAATLRGTGLEGAALGREIHQRQVAEIEAVMGDI